MNNVDYIVGMPCLPVKWEKSKLGEEPCGGDIEEPTQTSPTLLMEVESNLAILFLKFSTFIF